MTTYTVKASLNLRGDPSTSNPVIGGMVAGEIVMEISANADRSWLQVKLTSGKIGWASAKYLQVIPVTPPPVTPPPVVPPVVGATRVIKAIVHIETDGVVTIETLYPCDPPAV